MSDLMKQAMKEINSIIVDEAEGDMRRAHDLVLSRIGQLDWYGVHRKVIGYIHYAATLNITRQDVFRAYLQANGEQ